MLDLLTNFDFITVFVGKTILLYALNKTVHSCNSQKQNNVISLSS